MKLGLATRVGLAAALMLSASSAVMAAKVSVTGVAGAAVPADTAVQAANVVAEEQFGTSVLGVAPIVSNQQIHIVPSVTGAFIREPAHNKSERNWIEPCRSKE